MHDAFLKSVFADRRMVEILIHGHAPEWAAKIDFSTLREESTGLVSKWTSWSSGVRRRFCADRSRGDSVRRRLGSCPSCSMVYLVRRYRQGHRRADRVQHG